MSTAQFSTLIQKHIVSSLNKAVASTDELGGTDISEMRKVLEVAGRHTAVQSRKGWDKLITSLRDPQTTLLEAGKFTTVRSKSAAEGITALESLDFKEFSKWIAKENKLPRQKVSSGQFENKLIAANSAAEATGIYDLPDDTIIILNNISQSTFKKLIIDYLGPKISSGAKAFLNSNLQAGHLAGMAALKLTNVLGVKYDPLTGSMTTPPDLSKIAPAIDHIFNLANSLDTFSSNSGNLALSAFSEKLLLGDGNIEAMTEIQLASENQREGSAFVSVGGAIDRLSKATAKTDDWYSQKEVPPRIVNFLKSLNKLIENFDRIRSGIDKDNKELQKAIEIAATSRNFVEDLITKPSSPIITVSIALNIANVIKTGKTLPRINPKAKTPKTKIVNKKVELLKETSKAIKKLVTGTKKEVDSIKRSSANSSVTIRKRTGSTKPKPKLKLNLANLQALLNQALPQQIKGNMGTPALNNRTGRFAESVKVESISESRAGMISMFYSYMKRPYQTFQPGFAQGSNQRNPKTLISKSIREIASGLVGNRLRAVSL